MVTHTERERDPTYVNEPHSVLLQRNRRSSRGDEHNPPLGRSMLRDEGLGQRSMSGELLRGRIGGEIGVLGLERLCRRHDCDLVLCESRYGEKILKLEVRL